MMKYNRYIVHVWLEKRCSKTEYPLYLAVKNQVHVYTYIELSRTNLTFIFNNIDATKRTYKYK